MTHLEIEDYIADVLAREIAKEIDREVMTRMKAEWFAISLRRIGRILKNRPPPPRCAYTLGWKKDFSRSTDNWKNIKRFRAIAGWGYKIDYEKSDATFYFEQDEDRVAFLMLMR